MLVSRKEAGVGLEHDWAREHLKLFQAETESAIEQGQALLPVYLASEALPLGPLVEIEGLTGYLLEARLGEAPVHHGSGEPPCSWLLPPYQ